MAVSLEGFAKLGVGRASGKETIEKPGGRGILVAG